MEGKISPYKEILILEKHKTIFLLSGKCAGSSIRRLAVELGYGDLTKKWHSGLTYLQWDDLKQEKYQDYLKVLMARNPYSRLVSLYNDKVVETLYKAFPRIGVYRKCPFDFFIKKVCSLPDTEIDPHLRRQTVYWDHTEPDLIIKIENWEGWKETNLPKPKTYNKGKEVDWKVYYNQETLDLVWEKYKKDFELLNYKKESCQQVDI